VSTPRKIRIAVVFGGRSSEHAVSAVSAGSILGALDPDEYDEGIDASFIAKCRERLLRRRPAMKAEVDDWLVTMGPTVGRPERRRLITTVHPGSTHHFTSEQ